MERARKLGLDTSTLDLTGHVQTYFLLGEPNERAKGYGRRPRVCRMSSW